MEGPTMLTKQHYRVSKAMRQNKNNHKSCVLWLTGLSGSGKSTVADALDKYFYENEIKSYVLDGDNIRLGLNKNLGFSSADRTENIRRVGEVSKLFVDAGTISIAAFISPFMDDRNEVRRLFGEGEFIEVYIKCPIDICEKRDPKGLYKKAREGILQEFTGISSPYEEPNDSEVVVQTDKYSIEESVQMIVEYLMKKKIIK
ncbi:adenylyl-sulfate kinase [Cohnella luojiensis]|uniref:Adenylyl-sulfate kinase n=2 Tax=Cohnella luojiensis TaxID=652876 RepID=A0A4Y8M3V6_9BACL|nr:adenylyl-sulfate kinase [Cohnella luojiensis]